RPEQGLALRPPHRRGGRACGAAGRSRARRALPRHQFRPDRPPAGDPDVGRPLPGGALVGLRQVLRPPHGRDPVLSQGGGGPAMIQGRTRFTPLQRLLHWLMAACILAMLFIGVGMVSTIPPKDLTLASIHKPLGAAILVLALVRLVVRLPYGAPPLPADLP